MFGFGPANWQMLALQAARVKPPAWGLNHPDNQEDDEPAVPTPSNVPAPVPRPLDFRPASDPPPMPAKEPAGPGFLDRLFGGSNSDSMLAFGAGLAGGKNWGDGLSRGVEGMQRSQYVGAQTGLAQQKLAQQQAGKNATYAFLKSQGMSDEAAQAAMADKTILSSQLARMNRDPLEQKSRELDIAKKQRELEPPTKLTQETDAQGNIWQVNPETNKREVIYSAPKPEAPPTSVQEYRYSQTDPNYLPFVQKKAEAARSQTTVNVGGGDNKQVFDAVAESAATARQTAAGLAALQEARKAIEGGAILGAGADPRLGLQKLGAFLGVASPEKIINTETFRAAIAPQVASVLKSTVGTANISNTDREFAEKAAGGNINLDEGSIRRLLDIMERASVGRLKDHAGIVESVYPDAEKHARERALFMIKTPEQARPEPRRAPDGNFYLPDPNRPGKYLRVDR